MQLICSDNSGIEHRLTIGKVYEGTKFEKTWFSVTDDLDEEECDFYNYRFSTIQDWREKQLDKILI